MRSDAQISLDAGIVVRRAAPADFDRVLAVVHDSTRRVQEKGFNMWRLYLTDEGLLQVRRRVTGAAGEEVYLAFRAGEDQPIGTFAIEWSDPAMWGEARGNDGRAGYVHMLAVHRAARGTGLGERMLRFAAQTAAARSRALLRLDCWRGSEFLRGYYARLGFTAVGEDAKLGILLWQKDAEPAAAKGENSSSS
jgi:ribosomal protein S18 acetylase RimI-like enzyme